MEYKSGNGTSMSSGGSFSTLPSPYQWASASSAIIQPGAQLDGPDGCTLGFILRDARNETLYALTAGHCVESIDQRFSIYNATWLETGPELLLEGPQAPFFFGHAAAYMDTASGTSDWGLIEINASVRQFVSPSIRHWTGPISITDTNNVSYNELLCMYGWGSYYEESQETRHRCGTLEGFFEPEYSVPPFVGFYLTPQAQGGDSGSPLIHIPTGSALGILVGSDLRNPGITVGIPLCSILQDLEERQFSVTLATAPYDPPDVDPTYPDEVPPLRDSLPETKECPSWILDRAT